MFDVQKYQLAANVAVPAADGGREGLTLGVWKGTSRKKITGMNRGSGWRAAGCVYVGVGVGGGSEGHTGMQRVRANE